MPADAYSSQKGNKAFDEKVSCEDSSCVEDSALPGATQSLFCCFKALPGLKHLDLCMLQ